MLVLNQEKNKSITIEKVYTCEVINNEKVFTFK